MLFPKTGREGRERRGRASPHSLTIYTKEVRNENGTWNKEEGGGEKKRGRG